MSSSVIEEKTSQRRLARLMRTFSRRSPPSCPSGPKRIGRLAARRRRAIADRDEDHVAFVALDVLEILDEERLGRVALEECLGLGRQASGAGSRADRGSRGAERREKAATPRESSGVATAWAMIASATVFASIGLVRVRPGRRRRRPERGGSAAPCRFGRVGAGDDEELVFVELPVGHGDQGLVPAAVVPAQHPHRQAARGEEAEDAFDVADPRCRPRRPRRRRRLPIIFEKKAVGGSCCGSPTTTTCRQRAIAPEGVDGLDLARLVHDQEIEGQARPAARN